jgi:hypothetical protein
MPVAYNPWNRAAADVNTDSGPVRAIKSGDVGLGGLEESLSSAPPQVDPNVAVLGQMGARSADASKYAMDSGLIANPATGGYARGLTPEQMRDYLLGSASNLPPVGRQFSPNGAIGAGRTANGLALDAYSRSSNPLEMAQDPTADISGMQQQASYLRGIVGGGRTAAQDQLAAGLNSARAGQASIAAGVRGSQAAAARRSAQEAQLDITNQGRGQMATQQAADRLSAQGQLQDLNQGISTGLGNRQDLLTAGQSADIAAQAKAQAGLQESQRVFLANLATRNDLTAEQKQQMLAAWQTRAQADRMASTYGLRAQQMYANQQLGMLGTDIGGAAAGGQVTDRVNMAKFDDRTQRGAASISAIGAGAGMAIRSLGGGGGGQSSQPTASYAGADVNASTNPYAGYA